MLQKEKLLQAKGILATSEVDLWITLVRETGQTRDPILSLISTVDYTWLSALMVTKSGRTIALVGNHDEEGTRQMQIWDEVYGYTEDFATVFAALLEELGVRTMALNYSTELPAADGLTHGLYLHFTKLLQSIQYQGTICSAADIIRQLRGQKTPSEIQRIQSAIRTSQSIFDNASKYIRAGVSEQDIYQYFQQQLAQCDVLPAWLPAQCPAVMAGPRTIHGHSAPTDLVVQSGDVITVDFGVLQLDYCSDLQRVYYVATSDDMLRCTNSDISPALPKEVVHAFNTVREAVQKAANFMKPGITGVEVDTIARRYVLSKGYPEWSYALGHEVGRKAHDGGAVLGPRWPRYGGTIDLPLLEGSVFTLELGVPTSRGYIGLEEMVCITAEGGQFLSSPQVRPYVITKK